MAAKPTKMIQELVRMARANPGEAVRIKAYTLRMDGVSTVLTHYGVPIYNRMGSEVSVGEAFSASDRDAINSLFAVYGHESVASIKHGVLTPDMDRVNMMDACTLP